MKLSYIKSFFNQNKKTLILPQSLLIKKLKSVSLKNNLLIYENITIYHHSSSYFIPLLILDSSRGIYLFEHKEWSYDELKNATVKKATAQIASTNTLAFERSHEIIRQRFNELTHNDGVPIFNYLLMENLNANEYEHLDISFKELLPKNKIIFNDSTEEAMLSKLENSPLSPKPLPSSANIIGSILVQYCITDSDNTLHLCSDEQTKFINATLSGHSTLSAKDGSGRTNSILLNVILTKLQNNTTKIIIVKPTLLACETLKKRLLTIIENAIIEIDITSIEILTPIQLINKHLDKLSKPLLSDNLIIEDTLMLKKVYLADTIYCDDADFIPLEFRSYLEHIQEDNVLLTVSSNEALCSHRFEKSYRLDNNTCQFLQTNPHPKALQILSKMLESIPAKDILVISNSLSKEKLYDDLEFFIKEKAILLDSSKNLIAQDIDNLLLSTYNDIYGVHAKYIILMDVCHAPQIELDYACGLSDEITFILYEDECQKITNLRNKFECS